MLGGSRGQYIVKKVTDTLLVASKETGLEVKAEKTKYMVMSRDQNAGPSNNIQISNRSFERVEQFRYLGKTLTYQNFIHETIKCIFVRERLLSFGSDSFVFQFVIQKYQN